MKSIKPIGFRKKKKFIFKTERFCIVFENVPDFMLLHYECQLYTDGSFIFGHRGIRTYSNSYLGSCSKEFNYAGGFKFPVIVREYL